jgi:hypothetical protein
MHDKLFQMELKSVPYSSVVGQSLCIVAEGIGVVAQLMISVPQPHLDYKTIAEAVAKALMTHGTERGTITLVLPGDFKETARRAVTVSNGDHRD